MFYTHKFIVKFSVTKSWTFHRLFTHSIWLWTKSLIIIIIIIVFSFLVWLKTCMVHVFFYLVQLNRGAACHAVYNDLWSSDRMTIRLENIEHYGYLRRRIQYHAPYTHEVCIHLAPKSNRYTIRIYAKV